MIVVLLAAAATAAVALARAPSAHVFHAVDSRLCPFPLDVKVVTTDEPGQVQTTALRFTFAGPSMLTLRNASLRKRGDQVTGSPHAVDTRSGSITFRGHQVWFWSTGKHVPFLATDGTGRLRAPAFVLSLKLAAATTAFATVIGTLIALSLVRYRYRGKGMLEQMMFVNIAASEMIGTTGSGPTIGTSTSGINAPVP